MSAFQPSLNFGSRPIADIRKIWSVERMLRVRSFILRYFQVQGAVMAVLASVYAVLIGLDGDLGSAAFGLFVAAASVGFVCLAGWMRKHDKKRADLFPPSVG